MLAENKKTYKALLAEARAHSKPQGVKQVEDRGDSAARVEQLEKVI